MNPIRLIVADDEEAVIDSLTALVATDPALELVGTAHGTDDAIALAIEETPDVALIDMRMPGGGGIRAAHEIAKRSPGTKVVAFSEDQQSGSVLSMLRAGAVGYVAKDGSNQDFLLAIHRAVRGRATISTDSLREVADLLASFNLQREEDVERKSANRVLQAIHDDLLRVVFQPIVELGTLRIAGFEALARLDTEPPRPPDEWFAEAERAGLLEDLELVALFRALKHLDRVPLGLFLSVNASPGMLGSDAFAELMRGVPAERIVVEMTEQSPVESYEGLSARLRPLRDLGMRLAIDDVGAGYASLRHVVAMSPDLMKIDRTLISGLDADPVRQALVDRLASFAGEIGVGVVAEGVETEKELATLQAIGVTYAQGYHLGRPAPISAWQRSVSVGLGGSVW